MMNQASRELLGRKGDYIDILQYLRDGLTKAFVKDSKAELNMRGRYRAWPRCDRTRLGAVTTFGRCVLSI
jgi:hypothetical protein